jgi:hypothetical protein
MERGEFGGEDIRGRVEDVFWSRVEVLIPDLNKSIWFMRG